MAKKYNTKIHKNSLKFNSVPYANIWGVPMNGQDKKSKLNRLTSKRVKKSRYGSQLHAKQFVRLFYGNIKERQFYVFFQQAKKEKGLLYNNFIRLLESKLDTIVFRLNYSNNPIESRILINHGHILVNSKSIKSPNYIIKPGDIISVSEKSKNIVYRTLYKRIINNRLPSDVPNYLETNYNALTSIMVHKPLHEEIMFPMNMDKRFQKQYDVKQVIEFYSR